VTVADSFLIDASARHAVFLQRFAGGLSGEVQQILDEMRQDIERIFAAQPTDLRGDRVAAVLGRAQSAIELRLNSLSQHVIEQITELAADEAAFSVNMITEASTVPAVQPPAATLNAAVLRTGMAAPVGPAELTIDEALAAFSRAKSREIRQTIAGMVGEGATLPEISRVVSDLIDTRQKRHADTLTRTIVNHTSSRARHAALEENAGLLEGYEWVAVLDLRTTLICGGRDGMTYRVGRGPLPPAHWNCVLPGTLITSAAGVSAVFKRVYEGEVVTIETVSGNQLTVTPNHPILTDAGWVRAHALNVGDKCVKQRRASGVGAVDSDYNRRFSRAEDVFKTFLGSSGVVPSKVVVSAPDFHGDARDNEVAEVGTDCNLLHEFYTGITELVGEVHLQRGDAGHSQVPVESRGAFASFGKAADAAPGGSIGGAGEGSALVGGGPIHAGLLLLPATSERDAPFPQDTLDGTWTDAEHIRNAPDTYAGGVCLDNIIGVKVSSFSGHVYNLQTVDHCYSANGIVTHNCRSTIAPVVAEEFQKKRLPGFKKPTGKITPETTYGEWLKQQTSGFQDEALGPTRAKLFREGGLTVDRFRNETGVVYTLEQLQALEPLAFERASVDAVGARLVPRANVPAT
jgi:hypothetical protein